MKITLFFLILFLGAILAIHLSMNAQVGVIVKNSKMANALFWTIGAATAILIATSSWDSGFFSRVKEVPLWLLTAGMMGACLVFGMAWAIPQIGAGPAFVLLVVGQILTGLVFSHFGLLGSPVEPISWVKVLGAILLVGGASIVTFLK